MGYRKEDFFLDLNITTCTSLDDFIERIKRATARSSVCVDQASQLAMAIIQAANNDSHRGILGVMCNVIGSFNNSEVFIVEKRLDECEVVQAGFLPDGCEITFKNLVQ